MSGVDISLDTSGLDAFSAALKEGENLYLKVGILGDYAARTPDETGTKRKDSDMTNPHLGLIHEFGSIKRNIPERSWLRMPLLLKLPEELKNVDWVRFILAEGIFGALDVIGNKAVGIIARAFATGGFGQWQAWRYRYAKLRERLARAVLRRKHKFIGPVQPGLILVQTGQMSRAVTYAVVNRGAPTSPIYKVS